MGYEQVVWKDQSTLKKHGKYYYPSVDCGCLNISKAKEILQWTPTPIEEALRDTTEFFSRADKYLKELKIMTKKFEKVNKYYPFVNGSK